MAVRHNLPHRLHTGWSRFWFEPVPPANLGLCRILFFGSLFLYFRTSDFSDYGGAVSAPLWKPIWLYKRVFVFVPPGEGVVAAVQAVWKVSLVLGCLGLFTRVATAAAAVLGLFLLGLPFNYGMISHMMGAPVLVLGILAVARCGDAWSLDRLVGLPRALGGTGPPAAVPEASGEYAWPVRLVWVLLALVFFAAGVSKLRHSGLAWVTTDTLAHFLLRAQYPLARVSLEPLTRWGLWIASVPLLCRALAAGTIVLEVGYPLALCGRRLRVVFVGATLMMLVGVRLCLGPPFELLMICHLFWVPWDRVVASIAPRLELPGRLPAPS